MNAVVGIAIEPGRTSVAAMADGQPTVLATRLVGTSPMPWPFAHEAPWTVFAELRVDAESRLQMPVRHAVLAVSPCLSYGHRGHLGRAARDAGFSSVRVLARPVAAALAVGRQQPAAGTVAVGYAAERAGELAIVEIAGGVVEVRATIANDRIDTPTLERGLADACVAPDDIAHIVLVGDHADQSAIRGAVMRTFGRAPRLPIDARHATAMGAAVLAGILGGEVSGLILLDATQQSLGIETAGGSSTVVVPRHTSLPARRTCTLRAAGAHSSTLLHIVEGEYARACENASIGRLLLRDLERRSTSAAPFDVDFDLDADSTLTVTVRDGARIVRRRFSWQGGEGLEPEDAGPGDGELPRVSAEALNHGAPGT